MTNATPTKRTVDWNSVAAYAEEHSCVEAGKEFGISARQAQRIRAAVTGQPGAMLARVPPEVIEAALPLLEDRAGYLEAARSVGVTPDALRRHLPGYALTRSESLERASMGRVLNNLSLELKAHPE